jgi:hypothetical protein
MGTSNRPACDKVAELGQEAKQRKATDHMRVKRRKNIHKLKHNL